MCSNVEAIARAVCERELQANWSGAALALAVEKFWPVVAAQIEAGHRTDDGEEIPVPLEAGLAAWRVWQARHAEWKRWW
ncbi:hypothetical protein [Azorhizobium doebereinerae]|uniref:hypothetical protein n=1 Tax=Azorhizobium doebereinerae TaxID=281091 RepID=UPI0003FE54B9|nr:hypothetical protein [Azorhizobium doebereinerae]